MDRRTVHRPGGTGHRENTMSAATIFDFIVRIDANSTHSVFDAIKDEPAEGYTAEDWATVADTCIEAATEAEENFGDRMAAERALAVIRGDAEVARQLGEMMLAKANRIKQSEGA